MQKYFTNNRTAMKTHLFLFAMLLTTSAAAQITRDPAGNFHQAPKVTAPHDSTTTFTYTYQHGPETYTIPVYVSRSGKFYAWRLSTSGRLYRVYMDTGTPFEHKPMSVTPAQP